MKIKEILWKYEIKKKYSNINTDDLVNYNCYFIMEDNSIKEIEIYEFHGYFKYENIYIVYGHENIIIFDEYGKELVNQNTR